MSRSIKEIIQPNVVIEGAGVKLLRAFGPNTKNIFDPLLLFDHFAFNDPKEGPIAGFPNHPHRGIETVTYMLEGTVRHRDSLGNVGLIGPGGMQWMTSGRGIMHEEMPQRSETGNVFGFQLWINLPASEKMGQPGYQEVDGDQIPFVTTPEATVRIIAGQFDGVTGAISRNIASATYLDVQLDPFSTIQLPVSPNHTLLTYLFSGEALFGTKETFVESPMMLSYENDGDFLTVTTNTTTARFLFIAGQPFAEPIFPYGPFVMNTREEIMQAIQDLRNGTFVQN